MSGPVGLLDGQVGVVTGGGRGIGRQIATDLAAEGMHVVVTARSEAQLAETVRLIGEAGGSAAASAMDVTDMAEVVEVLGDVESAHGGIDLLVNNAGLGPVTGPLWEADPEDWWQTMDVNVRGVFLCCRAVVPGMRARGHGRIVNVGSGVGLKPSPGWSAYGVSKAALMRLSDTLAAELADDGISVLTFSPGMVRTEMTDDLEAFTDAPDDAWTPIADVGAYVLRLAAGDADALSGRFVHVRTDDLDAVVADADRITAEDLHQLRLQR